MITFALTVVSLYKLLSLHRSLAADTLTCKPLYNHILKSEDILSQAISIMTLNMKTVTVSELEVNIYIVLPMLILVTLEVVLMIECIYTVCNMNQNS